MDPSGTKRLLESEPQLSAAAVSELPKLTKKQCQILSIIDADGDALLFDLEVQELALLGLLEDTDRTLKLTRRGRDALAAACMR